MRFIAVLKSATRLGILRLCFSKIIDEITKAWFTRSCVHYYPPKNKIVCNRGQTFLNSVIVDMAKNEFFYRNMPRVYKSKLKRVQYSPQILRLALAEVKRGSTLRDVSERHQIPRSTWKISM